MKQLQKSSKYSDYLIRDGIVYKRYRKGQDTFIPCKDFLGQVFEYPDGKYDELIDNYFDNIASNFILLHKPLMEAK